MFFGLRKIIIDYITRLTLDVERVAKKEKKTTFGSTKNFKKEVSEENFVSEQDVLCGSIISRASYYATKCLILQLNDNLHSFGVNIC